MRSFTYSSHFDNLIENPVESPGSSICPASLVWFNSCLELVEENEILAAALKM